MKMNSAVVSSALAAVLVSSVGCAVGAREREAMPGVGDVVDKVRLEQPYIRYQSVWPRGSLENPGRVARLSAAIDPAIPAVSQSQMAQLKVGMTPNQVAALVGSPLAQGGNRRWEYLVRGDAGLFVSSIWFNTEHRLWMAGTSVAPSGDAMAALRMARAPAVVPGRLTIDASQLFDFDSARLRVDHPDLDRFAAAAAGRGDLGVRVEGYTDRLGSSAFNQDLSQRRAEAVRQYLIGKGIADYRIEAVGMAAAAPVIDCAGVRPRQALIACLAPNRRVEIHAVARSTGE